MLLDCRWLHPQPLCSAVPETTPIDLAMLARQTGNDVVLEHEVLRLFAANTRAALVRLKSAEGTARRETAHLIVGSARAVGAAEVAQLARDIEHGGNEIAALERAVADALAFVDAHVKG
jgi:HPt (histidine-containing phosphotransfer) domain-containing protein